MAINPIMMSALRALSYAENDVTKTYKVERVVDQLSQPLLKLNYNMLDHLIVRDGYPIPVRLFEPEERRHDGIVLFFHGGGWVTGNIDSYIKPCVVMANQLHRRVASVDYRLAPEYPFPHAVEDSYFVARELYKNLDVLGEKPEDIILMGDSAGGNIAACVSLMARDRGEFQVSRQVLIYPATYNDHDESSPYPSIRENGYDYLLTSKKVRDYISLYICEPLDMFNPYFAPMLAENLKDQPKTLVVSAEFCPLRDEGEAYAKRLLEDGNEVEVYRVKDALHGFFMLPLIFAHVKEIYEVIGGFLN